MGEADAAPIWTTLPAETRWLLSGKLEGLWNAPSDAAAFDSWALDKKQAMLLFVDRLHAKDLWNLVKRVTNVYGEDGVGLDFEAWPMIESTLSRRRDFTRVFANHHDRDGGFYEKERETAVLHFLFTEGEPRRWHVHFDLYSPVHSAASALKHVRHEMLGKMRPDWRMVAKQLDT